MYSHVLTSVCGVLWRLNPQCCPFGESYEWILCLISGMGAGGACPSGFPILDNYGSWSKPKMHLLSVDTPTLIPVSYLGPVGLAYLLCCSAYKHIFKCWARSMNSRTLLTQVPVSCYWVPECMSASIFSYMPVNVPWENTSRNSPVWPAWRDTLFCASATWWSPHLCWSAWVDSSALTQYLGGAAASR